MRKVIGFAVLLAFSPIVAAYSQDVMVSDQNVVAGQAAPVVRQSPHGEGRGLAMQTFDSAPGAGISVRSDSSNGVVTVSATDAVTELRVVHGRADVTVHHPANHTTILVDLPGGQVSLFKDGLYTFNAETNTVRVLHGEAEAYRNAKDDSKGVKVKETQQLAFFDGAKLKAVNAYRYELTADLLAGERSDHGDGGGRYGDGFYGGYPYFAGGYGYPFGYGYSPYGYGYPFGVGVGFGYYGGGFGGYRGGGFRGGGFRR